MKKKNNLSEKIRKTNEIVDQQGMFIALLLFVGQCLAKARIQFTPFYYMKEVLTFDIPAHLTNLPDGFEFSTFNFKDVESISKHPERVGYTGEQFVIKNFDRGDTCLGIKLDGEIAGFTWFSTQENRSRLYQSTMKDNEAYLYDMFVFKAFRGYNLAPCLRYKNYEVLKGLGRDTFYSVTQCSNTASFRFKQKLGSKAVFLGVHINIAKKWHRTLVLKKY